MKIIESIPEFAKLIPVYNTDLIYSLPNPRRQTDIAGIPSKIVNFQGLPKSFTYPEMDNFSPISKLLIKLNKYNPKIRAGLNVIYNKKMRETVRDLEYPYFFLNGKINEIREDGVIAFQKPDMGVVAATYVFGTDPDQILNITKKIVLKYVSK